MPAKSKAQRRFFGMVHGVQSGTIDPSKVSASVRAAAKKISPDSVKHFTDTPEKGLPKKVKEEVVKVLKEIQSLSSLNEINTNAVAGTFSVKQPFDSYIKKFIGQPILPKELAAVTSYEKAKPNKIERIQITYSTVDGFNNSKTTVVKKLKDGNLFLFTAFVKYEKKEEETPATPSPDNKPSPAEPATPETDDIKVMKSVTFSDEIKGGDILADFLKELDL